MIFDRCTVRNVSQSVPDGDGEGGALQHVARLRQLWADHVLAQMQDENEDTAVDRETSMEATISVAKVHAMVEKALAENAGTFKLLGRGTGGPSGLSENGTVLKRDTRDRHTAGRDDQCDLELGGIWERGDVDPWTPTIGWSVLFSRDGRWRPGYHLDLLLASWTLVIDYGVTRPIYRNRQLNWMRAIEVIWENPPFDVSGEYLRAVRQDAAVMIRTERERIHVSSSSSSSSSRCAHEYRPASIPTAAKWRAALQDRLGEAIAYLSVGEGLESPKGLVADTVISATNDIAEYERDALVGEINNIARGLTSDQQVVDLAAWILEAAIWAMANEDHDLADFALGSSAIHMTMWRYNTPRMARYEAVSIRGRVPGTPPELQDVADIVRSNPTESTEAVTYGHLYQQAEKHVRELYAGCSCVTLPEGHDAHQLLAQAMETQGNDEIEHGILVAVVALNNGAQSGDVRCDCGLDLLLYESFVRFFHPDMGIVVRMHYRTDMFGLANTVTE